MDIAHTFLLPTQAHQSHKKNQQKKAPHFVHHIFQGDVAGEQAGTGRRNSMSRPNETDTFWFSLRLVKFFVLENRTAGDQMLCSMALKTFTTI